MSPEIAELIDKLHEAMSGDSKALWVATTRRLLDRRPPILSAIE
jgi:hypothetical protein